MLFRSKRFSSRPDDELVIDISEEFGIRKLHFGNDDTQSAMRVNNPAELVLAYSRCVFGCLLFIEPPREMLLIGLGGGSIAKWAYGNLPQTHITCVELHQQVVNVARSMFFLPDDDARLDVITGDGAAHVCSMADGSADLIVMDAYSATGIAPPLATPDFFMACRDKLSGDGVLAVNLWGSDKRFQQYCDRLSDVFDGCFLCLPARQKGNVIAFGFKRPLGDPKWEALTARAQKLEAQYGLEFTEFVTDLARMNPHNDRKLFV
ncbi:Polyamine aminopropyltransferase [Andreprevotia sp. IGB-42]|uniref:spermine/spermidine synthase domain-containing protein n=1 Tax=Andreprevotia sp. IGB-42 TaxID=2497473 RepID=UPI00135CE72A|nr:spermidine synthase [Andreprevotia sp. IGB-42]KAF0814582.1 Polyamine aminopropyltransferase [Andreprevotia sp. IGB-42]